MPRQASFGVRSERTEFQDEPVAATDEHAEVTVDLGEADRGTLPTVYQIVQVSQQGLPPGGGWQGDGRQQTQQE